MVGIVCPSVFEYNALNKKELLRARRAVLCRSGMGKVRVVYACAELVRKYPDLKAIALIGFAGALTGDLKIGDVIEPGTFIEQDYCAEPFERFPNILRKKDRRYLKGSLDAVMLTQDKFLKENPYKRGAYAKKYRRLACDMESYAAAYFCDRTKIRYAVAKIISDSADGSADHDFLKACRQLSPKLNRVTQELVRNLTKG